MNPGRDVRLSDVTTATDGELVRAAAAGHEAAFGELFRRHSAASWNIAQAVTRNADDASDAVAEAFVKVISALTSGRLSAEVPFVPYLRTATRHAAIDVLRRSKRVQPTADVARLDRAGTTDRPAEDTETSEQAALAASAFDRLPERWRAVLWLTDVERMKPREAAAVLGLSANNVSQMARRARTRLREHFLEGHLRRPHRTGCQPTVSRLGAYVLLQLDPIARREVDDHLAGCPHCRALLAELDDVGITVRRTRLPVPVALAALVLGKWKAAFASELISSTAAAGEGAAGGGSGPGGWTRWVAKSTAGAAVAVILLLLWSGSAGDLGDRAGDQAVSSGPLPTLTPPPAAVPTGAAGFRGVTPANGGADGPAAAVVLSAYAGPAVAQTTVAQPTVARLDLWAEPDDAGPPLNLRGPQPAAYLVCDSRPGWVAVRVTEAPGRVAWARADQVRLSHHGFRILVERGRHLLTVYEGERIVLQEQAGIGPDAPLPRPGQYWTDALLQLVDASGVPASAGPLGPYALHLGEQSLLPLVGVHGTDDPAAVGHDASRGSIIVTDEVITRLATMLPVGVPVEIQP